MKGIIDECKLSTSGKSYSVKIGGKFYSAKLDSKLDSMVGKPIDFATEQNDYKGKTFYWITTWGPDTSPSPAKPVGELIRVPEQSKANGDRWWINFTSNTVAHAIAAGHIKGLADLRSWAIGARKAIEAADGDEGVPF